MHTHTHFRRERKLMLSSNPFKEFQHPCKSQIVEFILWAYHKDTPFLSQHPHPEDRRRTAATASELPIGADWVESIIKMDIVPEPQPEEEEPNYDCDIEGILVDSETLEQNKIVRQVINLIHYFLQLVQSHNEYELLISDQYVFWEWQQMMRDKVVTMDDDKRLKASTLKNQLSINSEALLARIQARYTRIYGDNESLVRDAEKLIRVNPETMARIKIG